MTDWVIGIRYVTANATNPENLANWRSTDASKPLMVLRVGRLLL